MLSIRVAGCRVVLAGLAVLTALFFASCGDGGLLGRGEAYPTFSLVGAPDRSLAYDYAISGPDMLPITGRVAENETRVVVEVPAGADRLIQILSVGDVYSGRTTADLAPGATTVVTIRLYPGPVFVDFLGQQIVQIRDMSGAGQRSVGEVVDGASTYALSAVDAAYEESGALWVASDFGGSGPELIRFYDLGALETEMDAVWPEYYGLRAVAVDTVEERLYAGVYDQYYYDEPTIFAIGLDGVYVENFVVELTDPELGLEWPIVSGLTVDTTGTVHALIFDSYGGATSGIARFHRETGQRIGDLKSLPGVVPEYSYGSPAPPIGDLRAVGSDLFVVSAISEPGEAVIFRYNLQLELQDSWGRRTESGAPSAGEFWGPRRFAATRDPSQLVVIDQRDGGENGPGSGRLVEFRYGTTEGWAVFGDRGEFEFFDTRLDDMQTM